GNFENIGRAQLTPRTSGLADKLFGGGFNDPSPSGIAAAISRNIGNTKPSDWSGALLEKFSGSAPGKVLGVIGGLHPVYNALGTIVNREVNPAIVKQTGIAPENLELAELVGGLAGRKKAAE